MEASHHSTAAGSSPAPLSEEERREAIDNFVTLFYEEAGNTWETTKWAGVPVYKLPLDLWVMQEIIFETRPELIIETGVAAGGSTLFFAHLLDVAGSGRVVGVDIDLSKVHERVRSHPRVTLIEASSSSPETVGRLRASAEGKRTMVILDSDHSAAHVAAELGELADLVSPGCYLIVEDTIVNGHPVEPGFGPGPLEALAGWLANDPPFEADGWRERLLASHNPGGYLRRRGKLDEDAETEAEPAAPRGQNGDGEPVAADLLRRLQQAEREREELRAVADEAVEAREEAAALKVRVEELGPDLDSARAALRRSSERVRELQAALAGQAGELETATRQVSWLRRQSAEAERMSEETITTTQLELEALRVRYEGIRSSLPMRAYDRLRSLPPMSLISKRRARRHQRAWQEAERKRLDAEAETLEN
jgi:cephalosporin hydroxylase